MIRGQAERPYLETVDVESDMGTVIDWATYLGTNFGAAGALAALRYYERVGWISSTARQTVQTHLSGMSAEELHSKKYDEPGIVSGPLSPLSGTSFGAHAKSLEFIATLSESDLKASMLRIQQAAQQAPVELDRGGQ
ncbi:MAG: putative archaeal flagellar protein D/E [halophilic archaeon J07HX5]|jgi:Putative archaeal flagellar protein D/E|nr:MAG: putative archaeal flagellar protein D/E [halophilic archaeon J07HX5]